MTTPRLPLLDTDSYFTFPSAESAENGIVGVGGNLSPGMLVSAYMQGVFPWFSSGDPILWWSPDPRFVLSPDRLHISRTLERTLRRKTFALTIDNAFSDVIEACGAIPRPGQDGTWITKGMKSAYEELNELGFAHSIEAWSDGHLVGGLYGVSVGAIFAGESMFSTMSDASKSALALLGYLSPLLGIRLIDCQVHTPHLEAMGARHIRRIQYLRELKLGLIETGPRLDWNRAAGGLADFYDRFDFAHGSDRTDGG